MNEIIIPPSRVPAIREMEFAIMLLVPEIEDGMYLENALELIHAELVRLKEIEFKYNELCK